MEGERENTRDQNEGSGQQQPIGQQRQSQQEFGQSSDQDDTELPGTGQSDLGTQSDTALAGRFNQQDLGQDQPGGTGGASGQQSQGGFVGSQGKESGEYLQQSGNPEPGYAEQGKGASNDSSDIEGTSERSENRESEIEGSSDNS